MSIHVIVELKARPGKRAELVAFMDQLVASGAGAGGFLGSRRFAVAGDPDALVELAEWESAEARAAHMKEAASTGVYAPLAALLAAPFRATVLEAL